MNNYVKVFAGLVVLIAIWIGISYIISDKKANNALPNSKQAEKACATSSGGG